MHVRLPTRVVLVANARSTSAWTGAAMRTLSLHVGERESDLPTRCHEQVVLRASDSLSCRETAVLRRGFCTSQTSSLFDGSRARSGESHALEFGKSLRSPSITRRHKRSCDAIDSCRGTVASRGEANAERDVASRMSTELPPDETTTRSRRPRLIRAIHCWRIAADSTNGVGRANGGAERAEPRT